MSEAPCCQGTAAGNKAGSSAFATHRRDSCHLMWWMTQVAADKIRTGVEARDINTHNGTSSQNVMSYVHIKSEQKS